MRIVTSRTGKPVEDVLSAVLTCRHLEHVGEREQQLLGLVVLNELCVAKENNFIDKYNESLKCFEEAVRCFEDQVKMAPSDKKEILTMFLKNYKDKVA